MLKIVATNILLDVAATAPVHKEEFLLSTEYFAYFVFSKALCCPVVFTYKTVMYCTQYCIRTLCCHFLLSIYLCNIKG